MSTKKSQNKTNHREFKHLPWKANSHPWSDQAVGLGYYCRSLSTEHFSSLALLYYQKLSGFNISFYFSLLLVKFPSFILFSCTIPFFSLLWRQSIFHVQWMSRSIPGNTNPLTMGSTHSLPQPWWQQFLKKIIKQ